MLVLAWLTRLNLNEESKAEGTGARVDIRVAPMPKEIPKDGFLNDVGHLIVDRDPLYTEQFKTILASGGVELLKLPASSPNLNAYAERFVRSIKEECLARVVPLGERHLRRLISEYVEHFHTERNHQGLANVIPFPELLPANAARRSSVANGSAACSVTITEMPRNPSRP